MSTHRLHTESHEVYFCTITCYQWLPLFEQAQAYTAVYTWFEHLKKDHCHILAYVVMPNHLHCLLFPTHTDKSLNQLVSEGKRFMAYAIVSQLKKLGQHHVLQRLTAGVQANEKKKGKKHQVFRLSFDARKCFNEKMIEQKMSYIHRNPVSGKWSLVEDFAEYPHSSASYYELDRENDYITHYKAIG
ncbi:REP-associated tyrosine transposase [Catalinimonas niigatensis]|uniref:REP-associated tyrosine transposase n=1 Tax=Catalinimonas niigatensis TaxID=1397264 RepID=UPI0026656137|nr:transposase [Catalinimonas niigatensis]WPP53428.1 transposase [Catalinimonas niigatensis]